MVDMGWLIVDGHCIIKCYLLLGSLTFFVLSRCVTNPGVWFLELSRKMVLNIYDYYLKNINIYILVKQY